MRSSDPLPAKLFGPYHTPSHALQPGDTQKMQFSEGDSGPCYMSDAERKTRMYNIDTGETREVDITKAKLISSCCKTT